MNKTEELKQSYTEQISYIILSFVDSITMEDAMKMHAKIKGGANNNFSACISTMTLLLKQKYSIENEKTINDCIHNCVEHLIVRVQTKIKAYVESHDFGTDKTSMDPIKVHYFFIESLFEDGCLDDMDYLKGILSYIFEDKFKDDMYDLHLLNKTLDEAKKGKTKEEKIANLNKQYGTKGLYNTFKCTYRLLKTKFADEIENRL